MRSKILPSLRRRIAATLGVLVGGPVAFLLYLAFLGPRFPWYQNLALGLAVLILTPTIVVGLWISWGLKAVDRFFHAKPFDDG